ncbi:MAG: cytochrome b [Burkholderiaceae bacterium]|nr:cytochrome b [Burkholderiaceae bacterium]
MNWKNTTQRYGRLQIGLHWLMLVLIAAVYALMEFRGIFPKGSAGQDAMKHWHFMLGMLVFVLVILRIVVRWAMPHPRIEPPIPAWQTKLSSVVHVLLYLMMLGLPLAGWLMFSAAGKPVPFFGLELPPLIGQNKALAKQIKEVHEAVASIGYGLIGLHAVAALFHHYWMHDNTLLRMLPERKSTR